MAKSVAPVFKRTNLFVVGVVLTYFGWRWFWDAVSSAAEGMPYSWLWGIVTLFIALFGLFSLGRAVFNE